MINMLVDRESKVNTPETEMMLSICCVTYNHEPYLRKALDGILMQKTNFRFEVFIGDDCSTDGSRGILREYEANHPGFFNVIYREKNIGARENGLDVYSRSKGKYVIMLETDDYWTDENKLQLQVDFLEGRRDFLAVAHRCKVVDMNGDRIGRQYPSVKGGTYRLSDMRMDLLPGQTATIMFRNYYVYPEFDTSLCMSDRYSFGPGDRRHCFLLVSHGKVYCLPHVMSCYRYASSSGSSFTATSGMNTVAYIKYYRQFVDYAYENWKGRDKRIFTAEFIYIRTAVYALRNRERGITAAYVFDLLKKCRCRARIVAGMIWYYFIVIQRKIFWPKTIKGAK